MLWNYFENTNIFFTRDSAFSKAGVETGDVVTEIDGTPIKTGEEMSQYLEKHPFGDNVVNITLDRKGKEVKVKKLLLF